MSATAPHDGQLHASAGDRLVIHSLHGPPRDGEIIEVKHDDGTPPYLVCWSDTGHETLVYPGPGARVQHFADETNTTRT